MSTEVVVEPSSSVNKNDDSGSTTKGTTAMVHVDPESLPLGEVADLANGIAKVKAVKSIWTVKSLWFMGVGGFLLCFAVSYDQQTFSSFQPFAASEFGHVELLGTINIVQGVVAAVVPQTIAKLADVYGRLELFSTCVIIATIGETMLACSQNISTFTGAQIFFTVGLGGLQVLLQILAGDLSDLRHRGIMTTLIPIAPTLVTSWTAGHVVSSLLEHASWRWGYGIFSVLFPTLYTVLLGGFLYSYRKARRLGRMPRSHGWKSHVQILKQMDPLGLILFAAGLALLLLPISLASGLTNNWDSAHIIAMIIIGFVCLCVFVLWEVNWATRPLLSMSLLKSKTILFGMITILFDYIALNSYVSYLYSYLIVDGNLSVLASTNVSIVSAFTTVLSQLGAAVLLKYMGHYKWIVISGIAVKTVGLGLMFAYRDAHKHLAELVVSQVFVGAGEGMMNMIEVGFQASVGERYMAGATGLLLTAGAVGSAFGPAIASGVWTNILPKQLMKNLPASLLDQIAEIFGSIVVASGFPLGSPERDAINKSYDYTMRILILVALIAECCALLTSLFMVDLDLRKVDQTRDYGGTVIGKTAVNQKSESEALEGNENDQNF